MKDIFVGGLLHVCGLCACRKLQGILVFQMFFNDVRYNGFVCHHCEYAAPVLVSLIPLCELFIQMVLSMASAFLLSILLLNKIFF